MTTIFKQDKLEIRLSASRAQMGTEAANLVAAKIDELLQTKQEVNIIFAAAPSQNEFLAALTEAAIPWGKINALHMDEYIGLSPDAPQRFGQFLDERLFGKHPFKSVHYLNGNAASLQMECERYTALLQKYAPDIACMGIGENTHLAFNDPHAADFNDPCLVKIVQLDEPCRQQQVNDGCFETLAEVPAQAITLTIPALVMAAYIYCMVPGKSKAKAVKLTLDEDISEIYPSTVLRRHGHAILFIDKESGIHLPA